MKRHDFKLILTVALKKEIPKDWLLSLDVPVFSLSSLRSGALSQIRTVHKGMLVLLTGAGLKASKEAARWVLDKLKPFSVLNIGSCGLMNKQYPLGKWIMPGAVSNEQGERIELDTRLPIPYPAKIQGVRSLISVREFALQSMNKSLKGHDAIDMECFAQAQVFENSGISFHSLKFPTDYSDKNLPSDFNKNLDLLVENTKELLDFVRTKKDQIRISVVVPVYNRERTIRHAIDSILSQSSMPDEIIAVNDGSTDPEKFLKVMMTALPGSLWIQIPAHQRRGMSGFNTRAASGLHSWTQTTGGKKINSKIRGNIWNSIPSLRSFSLTKNGFEKA
jgi:nucleoside phosphorylase